MKLIVLVGIPGSGKSSYAKKYCKDNPNVVHLSSDAIREELYGSAENNEHNDQVFQVMEERTIKALKEGKDVIYDATNLKKRYRKIILDATKTIKGRNAKAVFFKVPLQICLIRNAARKRQVPDYAIKRMRKMMEAPSKEEGFTSIRYIYR